MRLGLQQQARLLRIHRARRYPEVREREAVADEMIASFQMTVEYAAELMELLIGIDANRRIGIDVASNVGHGADYLLEVKANQSGWRKAIKPFFADAPPEAQGGQDNIDKGHARIEERRVCVSRDEGRPSGNLCLAPQPNKLNSSPWETTRAC